MRVPGRAAHSTDASQLVTTLCNLSAGMTLHRNCLLALLLAALSLSGASADTGVFVRFKLLEPTETSYYVQIGGHPPPHPSPPPPPPLPPPPPPPPPPPAPTAHI